MILLFLHEHTYTELSGKGIAGLRERGIAGPESSLLRKQGGGSQESIALVPFLANIHGRVYTFI